MPNDERAMLAVGMLTAAMKEDRDAFMAITDSFENDSEALGALLRLAQALVKMLSETQGVSTETMLADIALSIAAYEED